MCSSCTKINIVPFESILTYWARQWSYLPVFISLSLSLSPPLSLVFLSLHFSFPKQHNSFVLKIIAVLFFKQIFQHFPFLSNRSQQTIHHYCILIPSSRKNLYSDAARTLYAQTQPALVYVYSDAPTHV